MANNMLRIINCLLAKRALKRLHLEVMHKLAPQA